MKQLKDSTLVWLTMGSKQYDVRSKYGCMLLKQMKQKDEFCNDAVNKMMKAASIIKENNEIFECLNKAMGNQKNAIWAKAMAIKGLRSLKERD